MTSCRDILRALSDYLDDEVAAEVRRNLEAHIAECKTCHVIFDTSRRTLRILTDVTSFDIPAELSERLLRRTMGEIDSGRAGSGGSDASEDSGGSSQGT